MFNCARKYPFPTYYIYLDSPYYIFILFRFRGESIKDLPPGESAY